MKMNPGLISIVIITGLSIALTKSCADLKIIRNDNDVLRNDSTMQMEVIATQALNFNRFNQAAEQAYRLNSLIDASTEQTVIEYREILRREKTCDMPIPDDIAGGLYEYAHRLRSSAMHADSGKSYPADDGAASSSSLTYCQAVLWIKPLLAVIEKGNNNLSGIRTIEGERKMNPFPTRG